MHRLKVVFCLLTTAVSGISALELPNPCLKVKTEYGINCECNEIYCDKLNLPKLRNRDQFIIFTSSEDGDRFSYEYENFSTKIDSTSDTEENSLSIDQTEKYKRSEIIGFGGAWTGAVRYILNHFPPKLQDQFYNSYYSEDGIEYNLLRITIGGVDYDIFPWTYDMQTERDPKLLNFTELNGLDKIKNSQIKRMLKLTKNANIRFFGACWSPPLWMKANGEWYGSANNQLLPEYYQAFADYHARWLNLTVADGIPIWGLSTGNEPYGSLKYSCNVMGLSWIPGNQADWMVNYLMPSLQRTGLKPKISVFDDFRTNCIEYLGNMTERQPNVMDYAHNIALHPYYDSITSPEILDQLHQIYEKPILYTEMSFGVFGERVVHSGSWTHAEQFTILLIEALQHDVAGYIDWNLMLDSKGGPAYINGGIDAPIIAPDFTRFHKQPLFYAMAHFSKFIPRNSLRINATFSGPSRGKVQTVAYLQSDNKVSHLA